MSSCNEIKTFCSSIECELRSKCNTHIGNQDIDVLHKVNKDYKSEILIGECVNFEER